MLRFLGKHFRHWAIVIGEGADTPRYYRGPLWDGMSSNESLSYDSGSCRIGFDYKSSGFEREYIFSICRWMAMTVGLDGRPVVVYDGIEEIVCVEGNGIDAYGCVVGPEVRRFAIDREVYGYDGLELIRREIKRLHEQWNSASASSR